MVTAENIKKINQIDLENRKVELNEIADTLRTSEDSFHEKLVFNVGPVFVRVLAEIVNNDFVITKH